MIWIKIYRSLEISGDESVATAIDRHGCAAVRAGVTETLHPRARWGGSRCRGARLRALPRRIVGVVIRRHRVALRGACGQARACIARSRRCPDQYATAVNTVPCQPRTPGVRRGVPTQVDLAR